MPFITSDNQNHNLGWYQYGGPYCYGIMDYPEINTRIMNSNLQLIEHSLSNYKKVILIRLDFHMKSFTHHNQTIGCFFHKLKNKIKSQYRSNLFFMWVRERTIPAPQHYHVVVALSGHKCQNSWYIYDIARKIWDSLPNTASCYHPDNPFYILSRDKNDEYKENMRACIYRISYLAKKETKEDCSKVKKRYGTGGFSHGSDCTFNLTSYIQNT